MFGFLNSFVLPALAAAVIPLLLHLIQKRKTKTVLFSSLRFLKLLESKRIKHLKIYQWLLILIRTLFIVFIILAFARPTLKSTLLSGSSANTTAVIVLDDSYSMQSYSGALTYFAKARETLRTILTSFTENDNVYLILSSNPENQQKLDLKNTDFIDKLQASALSPDFNPLFKSAEKLYSEYPNFNKEFYFISDLKIHSGTAKDSLAKILTDKNIRKFFINPAKVSVFQNAAIDTVLLKTQLLEQGKTFTLAAQITNHNPDEAIDTRIHLFNDQNRLAMQSVHLEGGETKQIELSSVAGSEGVLKLHLELDGDDLMNDNFYYLFLNSLGPLKILTLSDGLSLELRTALNTLAEESNIESEINTVSNLNRLSLTEYDVILLNNRLPLTAEAIKYLAAFLARGKTIIYLPAAEKGLEKINSDLLRISGKQPFKSHAQTNSPDSYFRLQRNLINHPLLKDLFVSANHSLEAIKVFKYFNFSADVQSLVSMDNQDVLIGKIVPALNRGNIYLFSSALDAKWNNLTLNSLFVPLLYRLFYLAGKPEKELPVFFSEESIQFLLPNISAQNEISLLLPDDSRIPLNPESTNNGLLVTVPAPHPAGHYSILVNNSDLKYFTVNVSANELQPPFINFKDAAQPAFFPEADSDYIANIIQTRTGQELWFLFLILAFSMLVLETLLIKRIEGTGKEHN